MLMGVFMAVFLAGVLYYTIGIGDALLHREQMQDAADAAAFSAAVVHARGMNVIVLINIVMAALMAVIVALKLIEALIIAAMVVIALLSYFSAGTTAAALPQLERLRANVSRQAEQAKRDIFPKLRLLHKAARGVRSVVPPASELRVLDTVVGHYNPPAYFGIVIPTRRTLPTANDRFDALCEKAGQNVGTLIGLPFEHFGGAVGDVIAEAIRSAVGGASGSLSNWFCGAGEPNFEPISLDYTEILPILDSRRRCIEYGNNIGDTDTDNYNGNEHKLLCKQAENEERDSAPDPTNGYCQYTGQLSERERCESYWQRVAAARIQCQPESDSDLKAYQWQEQTIRVYYRYDGPAVGWTSVREVIDSRVDSGDRAPCERDAWNSDVGVRAADESLPVCSEFDASKCETPELSQSGANSRNQQPAIGETTEPCEFTQVAQIIGCERTAERQFTPKTNEGDKLTQKDRDTRTRARPQRIEDVVLGDEDFQLRSVVYGRKGSALTLAAEKAIAIASWGRADTFLTDLYSHARQLGRLSVAQAEYYYSGNEERNEWMWHMYWRARLKRFRMPRTDDSDRQRSQETDRDPVDAEFTDDNPAPPGDLEQAFDLSKERNGSANERNESRTNGRHIKEALNLLDSLVLH